MHTHPYATEIYAHIYTHTGLPGGASGKESTCQAGDTGDTDLIPGLGRVPWRRAW